MRFAIVSLLTAWSAATGVCRAAPTPSQPGFAPPFFFTPLVASATRGSSGQ